MHSKGDSIEITIYDKADEVIEEFYELILSRYQTGLKSWMKAKPWREHQRGSVLLQNIFFLRIKAEFIVIVDFIFLSRNIFY